MIALSPGVTTFGPLAATSFGAIGNHFVVSKILHPFCECKSLLQQLRLKWLSQKTKVEKG